MWFIVWVFGNEQVVPLRLEAPHHGRVDCRGVAWSERHDAECVFLIIWSKEGEFFLIAEVHRDLVVSLPVIEAHHKERAVGVAEVLDGVVASRDRVFEWARDRVEFSVGDAHAPNKILDAGDILLVRFCGEYYHGTPWPLTFRDPSVSQEVAYVRHDYRRLVDAIPWPAAADRWGPTCVDGKGEPNDWLGGAFLVEAVPILLDEMFEASSGNGGGGASDAEVRGEFGGVPCCVPVADVGAV